MTVKANSRRCNQRRTSSPPKATLARRRVVATLAFGETGLGLVRRGVDAVMHDLSEGRTYPTPLTKQDVVRVSEGSLILTMEVTEAGAGAAAECETKQYDGCRAYPKVRVIDGLCRATARGRVDAARMLNPLRTRSQSQLVFVNNQENA